MKLTIGHDDGETPEPGEVPPSGSWHWPPRV